MFRFFFYILFLAIICYFVEDPFKYFTMGCVVFILYEIIEISKDLTKK